MTVGFDVSQTGPAKAGCGFFADGLIRQLAADDGETDYLLYSAVGDIFWEPDHSDSTFCTNAPNFRRWAAPKTFDSCREFWRSPGPDFEKRIGSPTIFQANNFFCPRGLTRAKLVYTLYDLSFTENPDWTTEANRLGCLNGVFQASLRADRIVAISEFSKRHFLETFPHYPERRVSVVYPASRFDTSSSPRRPERFKALEPNRFWLTVGTIEPRKNHASLLDAMRILKAQSPGGMPLVLAGGKGWLMEDFQARMHGLEPQKDLISTGYVSDSDLQWLYENAFGFIYPSLFEGFGMPVLEAIGCGAAVLCSNSTSLPEAGGEAALYFDPRDPAAIAERMLQLLRGDVDRSNLRARALVQSKQFSWSVSGARLRDIYREVLTTPHLHDKPSVMALAAP